jgi:hypothetical protein
LDGFSHGLVNPLSFGGNSSECAFALNYSTLWVFPTLPCPSRAGRACPERRIERTYGAVCGAVDIGVQFAYKLSFARGGAISRRRRNRVATKKARKSTKQLKKSKRLEKTMNLQVTPLRKLR